MSSYWFYFILVSQGGLEVTVCTEEPLLSAAQLSDGNLLSVTLEAAYSVPEAFAAAGPLQNFMACLQVPAAGEVRIAPGKVRGVLNATEWVVLPHYALWDKCLFLWGVQLLGLCNSSVQCECSGPLWRDVFL